MFIVATSLGNRCKFIDFILMIFRIGILRKQEF